jgi:spore coat protein JC
MIFGTEELAHLEMVGTLVHQLTEGASLDELEKAGLSAYYTDHGVGLEYILKEFKIILII